MEEMHPIEILRTPDGDTVFDMGQNMVGWVRVQLDPQASWAGRTITLKHAEVLDSNGNFYTENLRGATQQVQFILDEDRSIYEPHFTFQGFRYVAVDGYPGEVTLDRHRHPLRHEGHGYVRDVRQKPQSTSTSGARRGTFSTCPRIAPSATSGWGGRATLKFSRARPRSTWTSRLFYTMARRLGGRSI